MSRVTFGMTTDSCALNVHVSRGGTDTLIGSAQWHPGHPSRFIARDRYTVIYLEEMEEIIGRLRKERARKQQPA